jgi:hypothetical protein
VGADRDVQARGKALMAQHPKSRYLRWARLQQFESKANAVHNQYDPDTGESLLHLDKAGIRDFRLAKYREMAEHVMADSNWGPFEEEAITLAHTLALASGEAALIEKARQELFEKYPDSAVVKSIKDDEAAEAEDYDETSTPKKRKRLPRAEQ